MSTFPLPVLLAKVHPVVIIAAAAAVFAVIVVLAIRHENARRRALFDLLRGRGFTVTEKPDRTGKDHLFAPFSHITALRHGGKGMRWHAAARVKGRRIELLEHSYTISSGKNSQTIVHTCIAAIGSVSWPVLTLAGEGLLARFAEKLGMAPDINLENDEFNRRWRVKCDDEAFALAILSPEVQQHLAAADRSEWWVIGGPSGAVCLGHRGAVNAQSVAKMIDSLDATLAAMPAEARTGLGV